MAGTTSLIGRRILAAFVAAMLVLSVMFLMAGPSAQASDHQIRICHFLGNEGYSAPIPTKSQIFDPDGHGSFSAGVHPGDIIPPFPAGEQGGQSWDAYPGKNWDTEGQAIWDANCGVPEDTTTTSEPEVTTTEPEVTTTEPEVTTTEPEVTTTEPEVTTTTLPATTTTIEILDSTLVNETTTTVEILDSTLVNESTTTIEDEVLGTEVLPFTGADSGMLALLAGALGLLGSLILVATKERAED